MLVNKVKTMGDDVGELNAGPMFDCMQDAPHWGLA